MIIAIYKCKDGHEMVVEIRDSLVNKHPLKYPCITCMKQKQVRFAYLEVYGWQKNIVPEYQFYYPTEAEWRDMELSLPAHEVSKLKFIVFAMKGLVLRTKEQERVANAVIDEPVYDEEIFD